MVVYSPPVFLIVIGTRVSKTVTKTKFRMYKIFHHHLIFPVEITQSEAYDILQKCVLEIQKRLIINLSNFKVAVVDKNGVRRLDDISSKSLLNYA